MAAYRVVEDYDGKFWVGAIANNRIVLDDMPRNVWMCYAESIDDIWHLEDFPDYDIFINRKGTLVPLAQQDGT